MRNVICQMLVFGFFALGASGVLAQTLVLVRGISFGNFAPTSAGGSIIIAPDGTTNHMGLIDLGGTQQSGRIQATGTPEAAFGVTFGSGSVSLTSGSDTLTLTNLTHDAPMAFDILGQAEFNVGGTLVVGVIQPYGTYSGNLTVSVNYE